MIVGDFYTNPERSMRVDFTPAWLRSTVSALMKKKTTSNIVTLDQANKEQAPVCVAQDTYLQTILQHKFPRIRYLQCTSADDCLQLLQDDVCALYVDDEAMLRYHQGLNADQWVLTREQAFPHQYMVWPMSFNTLPPMTSQLMKKWMYAALASGDVEELYFEYLEQQSCPVGRAGALCDKFCDPLHGAADARRVCVCESVKWTGGK